MLEVSLGKRRSGGTTVRRTRGQKSEPERFRKRCSLKFPPESNFRMFPTPESERVLGRAYLQGGFQEFPSDIMPGGVPLSRALSWILRYSSLPCTDGREDVGVAALKDYLRILKDSLRIIKGCLKCP